MIRDFINLLFPKVCASCDSVLQTNEFTICTDCRIDLPLTNDHMREENEVFQTFRGRLEVQLTSALFYFEKRGPVQEIIHDLKYRANQEVGTTLGNWHATLLYQAGWNHKIDLIVPVPIHSQRLRKRGFNQVTNYAKAFAEIFKKPLDEKLLLRKSATKTQVFKSRLARSEVTEKNYFLSLEPSLLQKYEGFHFLILDDILTTGVTLETCAKQLLQIPNAKVSIACMAVTK